jgi:hypothetical protein
MTAHIVYGKTCSQCRHGVRNVLAAVLVEFIMPLADKIANSD